MCGIVGYVGARSCRELLIGGLEKLEYRGYDSAGLSLVVDGHIESVRSVGNLSNLREAVAARADNGASPAGFDATTGIGHTRWATHGAVSTRNAHPHSDTDERVHIVLNGIVENYRQLRERLEQQGAVFSSDTDAEVVAHLIAAHYRSDLCEAVRSAYAELRGHYAFVAMSAEEPHVLVGARKEAPLVVGLGDGERYVASAISAFLKQTRTIQLVDDGEIVCVTPDSVGFLTPDGTPVKRGVETVDWDEDAAEKGGFETFMLKEIHAQPGAVAETITDRLPAEGGVRLDDAGLDSELLRGFNRVVVVACGTSYHAGLIGRYAIEYWARVPVEMDIASEYRYRNPVVGPGDLLIGISQSGETADTLAAMRLARSCGAKVLAVTNIRGSQATREADFTLFTRAGLEIGVAATKTFVAQVAAMYLFALKLAEARGALASDRLAALVDDLRAMPHLIEEVLASVAEPVRTLAERFSSAPFFLYLGRHVGLGVCLEGALKLKEISYIPTDAYAAGEMKHGPIALLDESTPVICVATDSPVLEKVLSNVSEVRARRAHVIAVATRNGDEVEKSVEEAIYVPQSDWLLQPLLAVVPLQLLAYYIARIRGLNVDQPRNLAKTVTVE